MSRELIRHVRLGDTGHSVKLYDLHKCDSRAQTLMFVEFYAPGESRAVVSFSMGGSSLHADDSDETIRSAVALATNQTEDMNSDQLAWLAEYGETLSMWGIHEPDFVAGCPIVDIE